MVIRGILMIIGLVTVVTLIAHGVVIPNFEHFMHALQVAHNPVPSLPTGTN